MHGTASAWLGRASLPLFVLALMMAGFAGGLYVARHEVFPYDLLISARRTYVEAVKGYLHDPRYIQWKLVDVPPDQAPSRRFEFIGSDRLTDPILVPGGRGRFREHCPDHEGCLAVEYAGRGEVRHVWPYRPDELEKWLGKEEFAADFPYEHAIGFSFLDHAFVFGASKYANGDLLAVFHLGRTHPYAGGVARIDRTGKPVWYRPDHSHHRPHLTDGGVVLVPGMRLVASGCSKGRHDVVNMIDGETGRAGSPAAVSVVDAMLESSYAPLLTYALRCNPTHVNSVYPLGEDAAGPGLEPGDLVVSMRNLHAFAILDRDTHRLKRLVRGGFMAQHAVLHFEGSRFLMLDNRGGRNADGDREVSRLLMVDAASGEETVVFPNHRTPGHLRELYTDENGELAISPDRRRALATFTHAGKAVEVRIADGAVLVVFDSLHEVPHLGWFPGERTARTVRTHLWGVRYGGDG